ncbi:MAG: hypothetical protein F4118_00330 [Acidimicrobiaceae bacterium]|nr:hypothetical protein [Candidatus Poribacteria bacterium]MYI34868.1 hypothetical protein [Acidimicrobiaceae bacterium]
MNNLYHYSSEPIVDLVQREIVFGDTYDEKHKLGKYYLRPNMKPEGFWFSPEDDNEQTDESWYDFCVDVRSMCQRLRYKYYVLVDPTANLLILDTVSKMYEFNRKYLVYEKEPVLRSLSVLWNKVALDYQGILIAPYHYRLRLHADFRWYYDWDCASGCIWDISVIQSITLQQGG